MQNIAAFKQLIGTPRDIVITTHTKPDADALGSSLGLALFLKHMGHRVTVITPTDYPKFLTWMKGNDEVVIYNDNNEAKSQTLIDSAEIVFCLDFSSLSRIDDLGERVREATAVKVLIDHHLAPEDFADFMRWSTEAAATAELVYDLIEEIGGEYLVDKDIAECLYAGIMTDTGCFKHPNTTENVFAVSSKLIRKGADTAKVSKLIYDSNTVDRIKFIGFALSERLQILEEYNTAFFAISEEDLKSFHSRTGDTEGLVNYALSIEGIKFAAMIIDRGEAVKMSFRSIGEFSVNEFARTHFQGGGHKNAAGGISRENLQLTIAKFEKLLVGYKEQLNPKLKTLV